MAEAPPPPPTLAKEGTFADPTVSLATDPRVLPQLVDHVKAHGACTPMLARPPNPLAGASDADKLAALTGIEAFYSEALSQLAPDIGTDGLEEAEVTTKGVDGNDITLCVTAPAAAGAYPVVVHTHGGGMAMLRAKLKFYVMWRRQLALKGLIVVGVDFRNVGGSLGPHPFPAGLNDCWSAVQWVHAHLDDFPTAAARPTRQVVVSGESGGGNLCLATALKACREGKPIISGVYSLCPYVAGPAYYDLAGDRAKELPSLFENDGIMMSMDMNRDLSPLYTDDVTNPLAWPLFATAEDLKDLPPTVVSVNESDPLRDEGRMMVRKLAAAGVSVTGKVVLGTTHAGDMMMPHGALCTEDTLSAIAAFAAARSPLP